MDIQLFEIFNRLLENEEFKDPLDQLMCFRDRRISVEEALNHPFFNT